MTTHSATAEALKEILRVTAKDWELKMDSRLISDDDLVQITGKKRCSAQAAWFKKELGVEVTRRSNGHVIMTWATFEALQAKKAGVLPGSAATTRPAIHPIRKAA
ncbi:DUF4224 domain-containing protein [Pandoraea sp. XJJ-1]|uniref:DUF4224 domain-containing protein n=1 Tax=Pandoraea sp. XJJ-1 TaxID=3002643 RepID=UPI00227FF0D6|nr:DUF4224 domain-containing protein [Pandoraea sp. XJJ-1]WAL80998.1 DUF4224 domain-containing protein [Pandoraea sp. XJJ-1]